ncbi:MAG: type II toxin-antitoxin system RelE/ParE family toxin [Coriobacteriales bacterium]|jgi:mRNA interferase RelE/StbE|nr:type II toxin-antitoxin system RelE/ParE family toxin [Coriobacteriales bacterium]
MRSYTVRIDDRARKQLRKLDKVQAKLIANWIDLHLADCHDPRIWGRALSGNLKGYWRYRVGSYRLMAQIKDDIVTVVIIDIDHRSRIYQ